MYKSASRYRQNVAQRGVSYGRPPKPVSWAVIACHRGRSAFVNKFDLKSSANKLRDDLIDAYGRRGLSAWVTRDYVKTTQPWYVMRALLRGEPSPLPRKSFETAGHDPAAVPPWEDLPEADTHSAALSP